MSARRVEEAEEGQWLQLVTIHWHCVETAVYCCLNIETRSHACSSEPRTSYMSDFAVMGKWSDPLTPSTSCEWQNTGKKRGHLSGITVLNRRLVVSLWQELDVQTQMTNFVKQEHWLEGISRIKSLHKNRVLVSFFFHSFYKEINNRETRISLIYYSVIECVILININLNQA